MAEVSHANSRLNNMRARVSVRERLAARLAARRGLAACVTIGTAAAAAGGAAGGNVDLLSGGGADILGGGAPAAAPPSTNALLGDIFGLGNAASTTFYIPPKQEWLNAAKG